MLGAFLYFILAYNVGIIENLRWTLIFLITFEKKLFKAFATPSLFVTFFFFFGVFDIFYNFRGLIYSQLFQPLREKEHDFQSFTVSIEPNFMKLFWTV